MWGETRTIGQKLYAGMGFLLLLTVLEGGVALWGSSRIRTDVERVTQRSQELQRALAIHTSLFKMESSVKGMLWAGLDNDRPLYDELKKTSLAEYDAAMEQLDDLTALQRDGDQSVAQTLRTILTEWKAIHTQIIELSDGGRVADALQLITTKANPLFKTAEVVLARPRRPDVQGLRRCRAVAGELAVANPDRDRHRRGDHGGLLRRVARARHQRQPARHVARARRRRPARGRGLVADVGVGAVDVAGRVRAGGLARRDVRVDGRDRRDDAHQRRQLAAGRER